MKLKLYEEYVKSLIKENVNDYESVDNKILDEFEELKSQIIRWFTEGSLAAQGCELVKKGNSGDNDEDYDFYISNNPMTKILGFKFIEKNDRLEPLFEYRVTFTVKLGTMNQPAQESLKIIKEADDPTAQPAQGQAQPAAQPAAQGQAQPAAQPAQGQAQPAAQPAQGQPSAEAPQESPFEINKVFLKILQFDENYRKKGELLEEVDITEIKEDFLIDKLGQLKDKSDDTGVDKNDLKDDIYTK